MTESSLTTVEGVGQGLLGGLEGLKKKKKEKKLIGMDNSVLTVGGGEKWGRGGGYRGVKW